jgi:iron complex outermembrane receptor protein
MQAQGTLWKIVYNNRIVTSYDPESNIAVDRNVGKVNSWGFDGGLGFKPTPHLNLIGLLSYTDAKLKNDVEVGSISYNTATPPVISPYEYFCGPLPTSGTASVPLCGRTGGKFVVETPKWQYGGRAEVKFDPLTLGLQAKHVSSRWASDVNDVRVKGYTTVDFDARLGLDTYFPQMKKAYLQLNVSNLLNEHYFGNLSTQIIGYGPGSAAVRVTPVATRAITGTLAVGF